MIEKSDWGMKSVLLSGILFVAAIIIMLIPKDFGLETLILLYLIILAGSIISFILGLKGNGYYKILSILINIMLLLGIGFVTFFLALAYKITEI